MSWAALAEVDAISADTEASLSVAAAAEEATTAEEAPKEEAPASSSSGLATVAAGAPKTFGASAVKGDGVRDMKALIAAGKDIDTCKEIMKNYEKSYVCDLVAKHHPDYLGTHRHAGAGLAATTTTTTPAAAAIKLKYGEATKLARKCKAEGLSEEACKKFLAEKGVPYKSLCRLILQVYERSVTAARRASAAASSAAPAVTASESSDEEIMYSGASPDADSAAPAADSVPLPRFAFESLD